MLKEILNKLYSIDHIPVHPKVKNFLIKKLNDLNPQEKSFKDEISKYIVMDPALSIEFLKIANSEVYGFKNEISSISQALELLENDLIKIIIEQHPVIIDFRKFGEDLQGEYIKIFKHSLEVQQIIKYLVDISFKESFVKDELVFSSSLHDIGLFFILFYYPENYFQIIEKIKDIEINKQDSKNIFIPDHAFIGGMLCKHWGLPQFTVNSISFHHAPWLSVENDFIGSELVYLGDSLSNSFYSLYRIDDLFGQEEHMVMRKKIVDILIKNKIDVVQISEIKHHVSLEINELFSNIGF